jgi:transposase-like protein
VQRYLPEFEKRWRRYARPVRGSWRMDETYIKVRGQWVYLYRAVDKAGQTVDFFLSRNRDVNAAKSFLRSAMKNTRIPTKITLDAYAASHRAVRRCKEAVTISGIELAEKIKKGQFKIGKLAGAVRR